MNTFVLETMARFMSWLFLGPSMLATGGAPKHSSAEGRQRGLETQLSTLQAQSKDKSETTLRVGLLHLGSLNGL